MSDPAAEPDAVDYTRPYTGHVTCCVLSPRGEVTNFHRSIDPIWGEVITNRVQLNTATHAIVAVAGFGGQVIEL